MNIQQAARELTKEIEKATAVKYELNPNVILEPGWKNLLGSVEANMNKLMPTMIKFFKAHPELLE